MYTLKLDRQEHYDEEQNLFFELDEVVLELEHSLVSLSKWESHYEKPFLSGEGLTTDESRYYIGCMSLHGWPDEQVLQRLTDRDIFEVNEYLARKQTATYFRESTSPITNKRRQVVTSELIYFWMVSLQIPFECETWNLNRLITLIRVINEENKPKKKMSRRESMAEARRLNAERRAQYNTKG